MKNPNGYGSVVKLSGKRRNPYMARITTGWDERGYPKYQSLGYFRTRKEGMQALAEYHANPYDLTLANMTFAQLYSTWYNWKFKKEIESGSKKSSLMYFYESAFRYFEPIHGKKFNDLGKFDIQQTIDVCPKKKGTKEGMRGLYKQIYSFFTEASSKDFTIHVGESDTAERQPFTKEEKALLWQNADSPFVDSILILLYTGLRISEMLQLELSNIDTEEWTITGGLKTEAGKNRVVPIHSRIRPFIEARMTGGNFLFPSLRYKNKHMSKTGFYKQFYPILERLNMKHTPHECRHTFTSDLDSLGVNETIIKRLVGHASDGVTEKVYIHKTIDELREAIEKLP